jgi:hypothetical protein
LSHFFNPTPVKGMSLIFLLAVQYNFDNPHNLSSYLHCQWHLLDFGIFGLAKVRFFGVMTQWTHQGVF